jgi:thiol-disulfide isomerase/thioredoxin
VQLSSDSGMKLQQGIVGACLLLLLFTSPASYAQINKCNINGKIVYTDETCPLDSATQLKLIPLNTTSATASTGSSSGDSQSGYNSSKWFNDHRGYAQARKISLEKNVPIFIYAYTDWCGYCKKLKKNLFSDAGVKQTMAGYLKVKINPEHSSADQKLFNEWGGKGYPTLFIQSESNSFPARTSGPFKKQNGKWNLMKKGAFIGMLKSSL